MAVIQDRRSFERTRDVVFWAEEERARPDDPQPVGSVEPVFVKVTSGTADGNGYYPGVVTVRRGSTNDWDDLTEVVRVKGPNGETLTNSSRYGCRFTGGNSTDEATFVTLGTPGGSSSLTVQETDGSPSVSSVTTLQFTNPVFVVSSPSGGVARVEGTVASTSTAGYVSTTASGNQEFSGKKAFSDGIATREGGGTFAAAIGFYGTTGSFTSPSAVIGYDTTNSLLYFGATTLSRWLEIDGARHNIKAGVYSNNGTDGITTTIVIPKATPGGTNGSVTVTGGIVTAYTAAT